MMRKLNLLSIFLLLLVANGCAPIIVMGPSYPPAQEPPREHQAIHIPKGHLPPPGHCRIWYPDRPAGHQPPPQRCPIPLREIPLGAYVVSRMDEESKQVMVKIYDRQRAGVLIDTQYVTVSDN